MTFYLDRNHKKNSLRLDYLVQLYDFLVNKKTPFVFCITTNLICFLYPLSQFGENLLKTLI